MIDIQSAMAEITRGKKKRRKKEERKKIEITGQKWSALFHRATIKRETTVNRLTKFAWKTAVITVFVVIFEKLKKTVNQVDFSHYL